MDDSRPIFLQLKEQIENDILSGAFDEEQQIPSTNEFAAFLRINPATANKAAGLLVDEGVLYKRRGIGMFVASGARERILRQRRESFFEDFVVPLVAEAAAIDVSPQQLTDMITRATTAKDLRA